MLMLFSVLDSTKNLCFTGIKQFRVLVRTGPRFSRETRHIVAYSWRGGGRVTSPSDRTISLSREYVAQGGTPQFDLSASPPRVPHGTASMFGFRPPHARGHRRPVASRRHNPDSK